MFWKSCYGLSNSSGDARALRQSCLHCTWVAPTLCATPDISAACRTRIDHIPASCTLCGAARLQLLQIKPARRTKRDAPSPARRRRVGRVGVRESRVGGVALPRAQRRGGRRPRRVARDARGREVQGPAMPIVRKKKESSGNLLAPLSPRGGIREAGL
mgnify:CR=1 FL=1